MPTSHHDVFPFRILTAAIYLSVVTAPICGETLHHWQFEQGRFLEDVVGGATLDETMAEEVPLPTDGPGSTFPSRFAGGIVNMSAVKFLDQSNGLVANNTTAVTGSFTIELFTHIEDLYHERTLTDAVFAAQVTASGADPSQWGWAFHVEKTAAHRQLSLTASDGGAINAMLSGISIEEETDYYVAAAFDVENGLVTFYAQDLTNNSPLEKDEVTHSFTNLNPDQYFQIGNAPNFGFGHVDGLIDEVRFSSGVVPEEELLINRIFSLTGGDFNENGIVDTEDITLLNAEVRRETDNPKFDLNADGIVDELDTNFWVHTIAKSFFGDANLDGEFNSGDLVSVFEAGEYEDAIPLNSGWATGDWNGDGDFDSGDFVTAFTDGGYELGPRMVANAVPEPTGIGMVAVGLALAVVSSSRRRSRGS